MSPDSASFSSNARPIILAVIESLIIQHLLTASNEPILQSLGVRMVLERVMLKARDRHVALKLGDLELRSPPLKRGAIKDDVLARNGQQTLLSNDVVCVSDAKQTFAILRAAVDQTAFGKVRPGMLVRDEPALSKVADLQHGASEHLRHQVSEECEVIAEEQVILDLIVESEDLFIGKIERTERRAELGHFLGI